MNKRCAARIMLLSLLLLASGGFMFWSAAAGSLADRGLNESHIVVHGHARSQHHRHIGGAGTCTGACIDTSTTPCWGSLHAGLCPGASNIECCVGPTPHCPGQCLSTTYQPCGGSLHAGLCPGPADVECCENGPSPPSPPPSSWTRAQCQHVAQEWVDAKIRYSWSATEKQYITSGQGPYRTDCSGFVSAAWNVPPPGAVVDSMPAFNIPESELQPCDALLHAGEGADGHVALFMGWSSPGKPLVVEECGHMSECCGGEATCPGSCGTAAACNEYCPGCPIQKRTWPSLQGFQPIRRNGW